MKDKKKKKKKKNVKTRDLPGGPVDKNLPCNAGFDPW